MTQDKTKKALRRAFSSGGNKNKGSGLDDGQGSFLLKMLYACLYVMAAVMAVVLVVLIAAFQDIP